MNFSLHQLSRNEDIFIVHMGTEITDKTIKENIRKIRLEQGRTQIDVADAAGIERTTYRLIECGKTKILNAHLKSIAEILNTSVSTLLLGEDSEVINDSVPAGYGNEQERDQSQGIEKDKEYEALLARKNEELAAKDAEIESLKSEVMVMKTEIEDLHKEVRRLEERISDKSMVIRILDSQLKKRKR